MFCDGLNVLNGLNDLNRSLQRLVLNRTDLPP